MAAPNVGVCHMVRDCRELKQTKGEDKYQNIWHKTYTPDWEEFRRNTGRNKSLIQMSRTLHSSISTIHKLLNPLQQSSQQNNVHNPEFYSSVIQSRSKARERQRKSRGHKTEQREGPKGQRVENPKQGPETKLCPNNRKSHSH